jgi:hypothetical protein
MARQKFSQIDKIHIMYALILQNYKAANTLVTSEQQRLLPHTHTHMMQCSLQMNHVQRITNGYRVVLTLRIQYLATRFLEKDIS